MEEDKKTQPLWKAAIRKKLFIMTLGMAGLLMIGFFVWIISKP